MIRRSFQATLLVLSLGTSVACATSGGKTAGPASPTGRFVPAQVKSAPNAVLYMERFHGSVEVPIDETGRPLTNEMRIIGTASADARREISNWIERMSFIPATRDGVPVRDVFKMKLR